MDDLSDNETFMTNRDQLSRLVIKIQELIQKIEMVSVAVLTFAPCIFFSVPDLDAHIN
jgi:Ni,Fe-hydrogenase III large subunit